MDDRIRKDVLLSASECARRMGLSVRALRLYERCGLISPRRTGKQWRLYGANDIARLNEVLALKTLGLSLSSIAELLQGKPPTSVEPSLFSATPCTKCANVPAGVWP